MDIVSWNILSGGFDEYGDKSSSPQRLKGFQQAIKIIDTDVVSLVDTHQWTDRFSDDDLRQIFGYPTVLSVKLEDSRLIDLGNDNGITVLSRERETKMESIRLHNRNAVRTTIKGLDIFSIYLDDQNEETRMKEAEALLALIRKNTPTLIIGDLNTIDKDDLSQVSENLIRLATKFSGQMKGMELQLKEMMKGEVTALLKQEGFADLGQKAGNTVPTKLFPIPVNKPIARLDYGFGNSLIKLEEFKVLTGKEIGSLSDHYPIWMRIGSK